jgi:hypothetical protein
MGGVPNTEALRTQALASSWSKGRRIARRRLAWRWTLWYAQQPKVWLIALLSVGLAWFWLMGADSANEVSQRIDNAPTITTTTEEKLSDAAAPSVTDALQLKWSDLGVTPSATQTTSPPVDADEAAIVLKLDSQLRTSIKELP